MLNLLLDKFTKELPNWRRSCVKNMLLLSLCILEKESCCLNKLKNAVGKYLENKDTKVDSHYKRLTRFFVDYAFSRLWLDLVLMVFKLLRKQSEYLLLDGTSWQRGNKVYHYLVLAVVYQGVAIPIYWEDMAKKGTSSQKERKRLFRKASRYFKLKGKILLADREYIGTDWFNFLIDNDIDFVIRLRRRNYRKEITKAAGKSYDQLEDKVLRSKREGKTVAKCFELAGKKLSFVIVKNPKPSAKEPLIYLLSSLDEPARKIAQRYPIRWQIELCFKHLKSNGFDLEKANLKGKPKNKLLMAILVFSYTLSILEGLKSYKNIPYKTYQNNRKYKAISLFRYGLDLLVASVHSLTQFSRKLLRLLRESKGKHRSPNSIFVQ